VIRWIAATGAFVITLDSMVNIAFPLLAAWFHRPPEAMRWVIIPYVFSYAITSFVGGIIADRIGHARVFRLGLAGAAVAFALASLAPTFGWLVGARVIQGLLSGLVYGTAPGIITLASLSGQRGRALGLLNAAIGFSGVIGPIVAGVLIDVLGWQAVFAVRVPIALVVLAWASIALPHVRAATDARIVRAREIFRVGVLVPGLLSFVANGGIFAIWLLAPFYLVDVRGLSGFGGGLMFMLTPLGTALAAPLSGRALDRIGARAPMTLGLALEALGLVALSFAAPTTPIAMIALALFAAGFGLGAFQVPNMTLVMNEFPAGQQGAAGGWSFMSRTLGIVCGVAALSTIFGARNAVVGFESAFATAFIVAAAAVGLAALASVVSTRAAERRARF
jgi:MFS family permease